MTVADYQLVVDWGAVGDFGATNDDITAFLRDCDYQNGYNVRRTLTANPKSGRLIAQLNNTSGHFSSFNTSSPLTGTILPVRKVQFRRIPFFGHALDFSGADQDVQISDDAAIQNIFDGGGTIEAWVDVDSDGEGNVGRIFDKTAWFLYTSNESGGKVKLTFRQNFSGTNGAWDTTSTVVTIGTRHHIALVYDSDDVANNPNIYVDGVSVSLTESSTPVGTRTTDVGSDLFLGDRAADDQAFDGRIDEPRLWSDTRTNGEITANKDIELIGTEAGLAGYWRFNEGSGSTATDATSNGNDGTITGATYTFKGSILWTGFLTRIVPDTVSMKKAPTVKLEAAGLLSTLLRSQTREVAVATTISMETALLNVLTDAGMASGDISNVQVQGDIVRWWTSGEEVFAAVQQILATEVGNLIELNDGTLEFQGRHFRYTGTRVTSQATFSDASGAVRSYQKIKQVNPLPLIYNDFNSEVTLFTVGSLATLWTHPEVGANSPKIDAGGSIVLWARYPNPQSATNAVHVDVWTTPVSSTDYTANSQADGGGHRPHRPGERGGRKVFQQDEDYPELQRRRTPGPGLSHGTEGQGYSGHGR